MPPTAVPTSESPGDAPTPMSLEEIQAPTLFDEPQPPAMYPLDDDITAATGESSSVDPQPMAQEPRPAAPRPPSNTLPEVVRTRSPSPPTPPPKPSNKRRRLIIVGLGAVLVLCVLILVGAVVARQLMDRAQATQAQIEVESGASPDQPTQAPPPSPPEAQEIEPDAQADPDPDPAPSPQGNEVDITRSPGEFARIRFPALRRNTRSPQIYTQAPPSPAPRISIQKEIGRGSGCAGVEQIIDTAIQQSPAFSPLYRDLWNCYRDLNDPHVGGQLDSALYFIDKRPHLEGTLTQPDPGRPLPLWFLPAQDGIERRMDLYHETAGIRDGFHDVINDAIDAEIVASRFHYDLLAMAAYAAAFANLPNPTSAQIQDWARRVYTVRKHRDSTVGRLVQEMDPAASRRIRDVLAGATFDFEQTYKTELSNWLKDNPGADRSGFDWRELADRRRLPHDVAQAVLVGADLIASPTGTRPEPVAEEQTKTPVRQRDPCEVNPTDPRCIP